MREIEKATEAMGDLKQLTELELVDRALAALNEIQKRWREVQPSLRLPVIDRVLELRREIIVK